MRTKQAPFLIFGLTLDGEETACGRYRTLTRAQKALEDLDFALFSQRDAGIGSAIIAYQIQTPDGLVVRDGL